MKYIILFIIFLFIFILIFLRYFYPTPFLSQKKVNELYRTMKNTDEILTSNNVPYFISCGTLLGSVRDGGLIPWDNDIDICIFKEDLNKFLALQPQFQSKNHTLDYEDDIHRIRGNLDGVWIDVFLYSKEQNKPVYEHTLKKNKNRFPKEYFYENELFPLKKSFVFGDLLLSGPQKEEILLERMYGKTWRIPVQYSKMGGFLMFLKKGKNESRRVALPSK